MKTYKSKIGFEICIPVALILGIVAFHTINNEPHWPGILLMVPLILFIAYVLTSISYSIQGDTLIIKSGILYTITIDIKTIKKIKETRNPISSPAASLDRLEITYELAKTVPISPLKKSEFIDEIKLRNPSVEVMMRSKGQVA